MPLMEGPSDAPLDDEIKDEVTTRISKMLDFQSPNPSWLRICKVQDNLRDVNERAYEPVVLSIGPYHHGKAHLQKMEDLKLRSLRSLLKRRNETDASRYVNAMREMEEKAWECYADPFKLDKDDFVMMMVLDSCFIIGLFLESPKNEILYQQEDYDDAIEGQVWMLKSIRRDLLLYENQLPYFIFPKMLEMVALPVEEKRFNVLAENFFWPLLERNRDSWQIFFNDLARDRASWQRFFDDQIDFDHLLGLLHYYRRPLFARMALKDHNQPYERRSETWTFKFSAIELKEAGVKFKKVEELTPPLEIKFTDNGVLEIPPLEIDHYTESLFRNLIAFEQQPRRSFTSNYIIDYIRFMDNLINSVKDVQILRRSGIIENGLGDDETVCTMFNKLCENVFFASKSSCYSEVLKKIENHRNRRWHAWMANLRHNYFNSPWALISVLAAGFVILLAITQTVYAIISYYKKS